MDDTRLDGPPNFMADILSRRMTDQCRLYLISPPLIGDGARFAETLKAACGGGDVAAFQLRMKSPAGDCAEDGAILRVTTAIRPVLQAAGVHFIMNDRPDLAKTAGADGVHIGQKDAIYADARATLGPEATIGVTCHNSYDLAIEAAGAGADYVAFGAFFPSPTKEATARADPTIIADWAYATTVPCVAIGGITADNCGPLVRAGADFIAVSAAVFAAEDGPAAAVARINAAIIAACRAA